MDAETDDVAPGVDENATANYTIKDVTWRDRRRMRTNSRKHGVAARELLSLALDALEERDSRMSVLGPTIDQNAANPGPPLGADRPTAPAYSPLDALERLAAIYPQALQGKGLQRALGAAMGRLVKELSSAKRLPAFQNGFAAIQAAREEGDGIAVSPVRRWVEPEAVAVAPEPS